MDYGMKLKMKKENEQEKRLKGDNYENLRNN